MKNEVSSVVLEVGGKEYTLFMNRIGLVNWEKKTKFAEFEGLLEQRYAGSDISKDKEIEITDETNPFEMYEETSNLEKDEKEMIESMITFYWIALYTHHKMTLEQAREWFNLATYGNEKEAGYGEEQMLSLLWVIIDNVTSNKQVSLKNMEALKPIN